MSDRVPMPRVVIVATALVAVLAVLAIVVANAPANWLALYVAHQTHGVVSLADAQGTIWSGSAVVAVGAPNADGNNPQAEQLALPGRVIWTLQISGMLAPVLHLTHDGVLLQPLTAHYVDGGLTLDAGSAVLPASLLRLVGAPLNTLLPEGRCELRWNGLRVDGQGPATGEGTLRIGGFALALSPVKPLGDYLVTWSSSASGLAWQIATERGPLALQGNGSLAGSRVQVHVVARAAADVPAAVVAQLGPLLDMVGRRGSEEAVIAVGS